MPADVLGSLITFIEQQLTIDCWDGEIPRQDTSGNEITLPASKPIFKVVMTEQGLERDWTLEDAYSDSGEMTIYLWATTRAMIQLWLGNLETLLAQSTNWPLIITAQPYNVIQVLITRWTNLMLENVRAKGSQYIYEGRLSFIMMVHGEVSTR